MAFTKLERSQNIPLQPGYKVLSGVLVLKVHTFATNLYDYID